MPQHITAEGNLEKMIDAKISDVRWLTGQCAEATRKAATGEGKMEDYHMALTRRDTAQADLQTLHKRRRELERFAVLAQKFNVVAQGVSDSLKAFRSHYDSLHVMANRICASFPGDAALCAPLQPSALRRMVEIELTKTVVSDLRAPQLPNAIGAGDMEALIDPAGTKPLGTLAADLADFLVAAYGHHLENKTE